MANQSSSDSSADLPDRLADLLDIRSKLIAASVVAEPGSLPAIARELRLVGAEIANIAPAEETDLVDDLAARRAARIAGTHEADPPAKGGKRGG